MVGFALALVFVSVVQCAQYESWTTPLWVIMSAPLALLGTVGALMMRGADMNLYDQIGIVLLVAMASKHAILILEFAKDERERWLSIVEAVLTPAKRRFRPILVTAISSLLGVLPLVAASGARAVSRQAEGAAVFGGMLAAAFFSVVSVPVFYVVMQGLSERLRGKKPPKGCLGPAHISGRAGRCMPVE